MSDRPAVLPVSTGVALRPDKLLEIYTYNGTLLKSYQGRIYIDRSSEGTIHFTFEGKSHIIANALVIISEI